MISDVTDIHVYNKAIELLPELYLLLKKVPPSESDLTLQAKRAAKSVPANIAEGFAKRRSEKEFKRYLLIALGSNDELIAHIHILSIVVPLLAKESLELLNQYKVLSK